MNKKQKDRTINSFSTGITMPLEILEKIDSIRQDIPRSRFLLRIIEKNMPSSAAALLMEMEKPQSPQGVRPMETEVVDNIASTPLRKELTQRVNK